jgi:hypothetical protein
MQSLAVVRFRYRKAGSTGAWTISSWSGRVLHQSEALVLQELRRQKRAEVELIEIRWR